MRRKLQLHCADVKYRHHILLEGVTQDVDVVGGAATTVHDTGDADVVAVGIGASKQDHVERVDGEAGTTDGDAVSRWRGIAVNDVGAFVRAVGGCRAESAVHGVCNRGWVVVEGSARVNLANIMSKTV